MTGTRRPRRSGARMSSSSAAGSSACRCRRPSRGHRPAGACSLERSRDRAPAHPGATRASSSTRSTRCSSTCISRRVALYRALAEAGVEGFALPAEPAGLLMRDPRRRRSRGGSAATLPATHPDLSPTFLAPGRVRRPRAVARRRTSPPAGWRSAIRSRRRRRPAPTPRWATRLGVEIRRRRRRRGRGSSRAGWPGVELADGERLPGRAGRRRRRPVDAGARSIRAGPGGRSGSSWGVVVAGHARGRRRATSSRRPRSTIEPGDASRRRRRAGDVIQPRHGGGASSLGLDVPRRRARRAGAWCRRSCARGARLRAGASRTRRIGRHRVCARPQSLDGRPLVGRVPGIDGLWVAAGHGPWGISTGPGDRAGCSPTSSMAGRGAAAGARPARFAPPRSAASRSAGSARSAPAVRVEQVERRLGPELAQPARAARRSARASGRPTRSTACGGCRAARRRRTSRVEAASRSRPASDAGRPVDAGDHGVGGHRRRQRTPIAGPRLSFRR